jgi:hypothetical protein
MGTLTAIIVPFLVIVAAIGVVLTLRERALEPVAGGRRTAVRPLWGTPGLWVAVCALLVLLGLFVAPRLLGGVFLFLPFVWVRGRRDRHPPDA